MLTKSTHSCKWVETATSEKKYTIKFMKHTFVSATGGSDIASADPSTTTPLPSADTPLKKRITHKYTNRLFCTKKC